MKQIDLIDFRGGYCTSVAQEIMARNELLQAKNCFWESGLRKAKGTAQYDQWLSSSTSIVGAYRLYTTSWYNIFALDNGTSVTFWHSQSSTTGTIITGYNFTTGYDVEFSDLDGNLVFVNGQNKPGILYCTSTWEIMNLETYDTRDRGTATWWAGFRDASSVTASMWLGDTDDAQSSATGDFLIAHSTFDDGYYIACTYTFNKLYLYNIATTSASTFRYYYYTGNDTWTNLTLISSITISGSPPSATQVIEFNIPTDWTLGDAVFSGLDDLENHYIFLGIAGNSSATTFVGTLSLQHSQYLTQVTGDDRAQSLATHNRFLHLAAGNNVYLSDYGTPTGWEVGRAEYFLEGGVRVISMLPFREYLLVFKENALYGFSGNAVDGWVRTRLANETGCIAKRSPAVVKDTVFYVARDGIWIWNGTTVYKVSGHIQSDFDSWVPTTAVGINYKGEYWLSFPSSTYTIRTDPDSFRTDEIEEGRVSWFKRNLGFTQFLYNKGAGDNGNLYGAKQNVAGARECLVQLEVGDTGKDVWGASTTAIDMVGQTPYKAWDTWAWTSRYLRFKPMIAMATASTGITCTHALMANMGSVTITITQYITSGTGWDMTYQSLPYTLDGENMSYYFRHNGSTSALLAGVSFITERRYF